MLLPRPLAQEKRPSRECLPAGRWEVGSGPLHSAVLLAFLRGAGDQVL